LDQMKALKEAELRDIQDRLTQLEAMKRVRQGEIADLQARLHGALEEGPEGGG